MNAMNEHLGQPVHYQSTLQVELHFPSLSRLNMDYPNRAGHAQKVIDHVALVSFHWALLVDGLPGM